MFKSAPAAARLSGWATFAFQRRPISAPTTGAAGCGTTATTRVTFVSAALCSASPQSRGEEAFISGRAQTEPSSRLKELLFFTFSGLVCFMVCEISPQICPQAPPVVLLGVVTHLWDLRSIKVYLISVAI